MRQSAILLLVFLLASCSLGRSPTPGQWVNPPLVEAPAIVYDKDGATGILHLSLKGERDPLKVGVTISPAGWEALSAWVSQTYEDGKVRWRVLEEANRP